MSTILFHVGAPKCGSSALQFFFSQNPVLKMEDGRTLYYIGFYSKTKTIVQGRILNELSQSVPHQYINSAGLIESLGQNKRKIDEFVHGMQGNSSCFVMSNEDWTFDKAARERFLIFLDALDCEVELVIYIRPQIHILNSAWWQWSAWGNQSLDDMINDAIIQERFFWNKIIIDFKRNPRVKKVHIKILDRDIVSDFIKYFSINFVQPSLQQVNKSLPGQILRIYQRNKTLRPNQHASGIDFSLERALTFSSLQSTPWVLDQEQMQFILRSHYTDNLNLIKLLPDSEREKMELDKSWWDIPSDKHTESSDSVECDPKSLESITVESLKKLASFDQEMLVKNSYIKIIDQVLFGSGEFQSFVENTTPETLKLLATLKLSLSSIYDLKGDTEGAINVIKEALLLVEDCLFYHQLGILLKRSGDLEGAKAAQLKAIALDPSIPGPHAQLSHIYNQLGDMEQAIQKIKDAIGLKDDTPQFYQHLGNLLKINGDLEGVKEAELKASSLSG